MAGNTSDKSSYVTEDQGKPQSASTSEEAPAEKSWHEVKSWSGTAAKKTEAFQIQGKQWRITWTNRDTSGFNANILIISVYEPEVSFPRETINAQGSGDTSYIYRSGTFYLDINAANTRWSVTVEDYY